MILRWRPNGCDDVSNHQPQGCLLNRLFRRRSKKTSKLRVTGLCEGNSPVTGEFPSQMASNTENASISWRYHDLTYFCCRRNVPHITSGLLQCVISVHNASQNQISRNLVCPQLIVQLSNRFVILYRARQYHCRALYKFSKRIDNWDVCYRRNRFCEIWV